MSDTIEKGKGKAQKKTKPSFVLQVLQLWRVLSISVDFHPDSFVRLVVESHHYRLLFSFVVTIFCFVLFVFGFLLSVVTLLSLYLSLSINRARKWLPIDAGRLISLFFCRLFYLIFLFLFLPFFLSLLLSASFLYFFQLISFVIKRTERKTQSVNGRKREKSKAGKCRPTKGVRDWWRRRSIHLSFSVLLFLFRIVILFFLAFASFFLFHWNDKRPRSESRRVETIPRVFEKKGGQRGREPTVNGPAGPDLDRQLSTVFIAVVDQPWADRCFCPHK